MKKSLILLLLLLLCACSNNDAPITSPSSFILHNVNIIDVENGSILPAKSIVIKQGEIADIIDVTSSYTPSALAVIDGKNGYVTPGLIDMHVHMYEPAAYVLALSHGVTHVRIMNGVPEQLKWRDQIAAGSLIGSSSSVSSPIISGYEDAPLHHTVHTAAAAEQAVKSYHSQGYDLIKAYGNLNEQSLTAIIKAGQKLAMPIAKHGPHGSGDMPLSALSGLQSFEHVEDIYQGTLNHKVSLEKLDKVSADLKRIDVPVTPTLNIYHQLTQLTVQKEKYLAETHQEYTSDIIAFEAKSNQVERWLNASQNMAIHNKKIMNFLLKITKTLHESEVELLVGSDSGVLLSPHGLATHNEMKLLAQAGLNNYEVLAAATINPAKALNLATKLGKVAPNFKADFIYSTSNPIVDLSVLQYPQAVVKHGQWYSQQQLQTLRDEAINSRSFWQELFVLGAAL